MCFYHFLLNYRSQKDEIHRSHAHTIVHHVQSTPLITDTLVPRHLSFIEGVSFIEGFCLHCSKTIKFLLSILQVPLPKLPSKLCTAARKVQDYLHRLFVATRTTVQTLLTILFACFLLKMKHCCVVTGS